MTEQDILRVVDSCGGAEQPDESADWSRGYNEALNAVERELKRYFTRTTHAPSQHGRLADKIADVLRKIYIQ